MSTTIVTLCEGVLQSHDRFAIAIKPHTVGTTWRWRIVRFREEKLSAESLLLFFKNITYCFKFIRYTWIMIKAIGQWLC